MNKKNRLNILHISYSLDIGGAARAAHRIHLSLIKSNVNSKILTIKNRNNYLGKNYISPKSLLDVDAIGIKKIFQVIFQFFLGQRHQKISLNIFPSNFHKIINLSNIDIVNIHWIGNETLSLKDLAKIKKPIVWTMHDMSPFKNIEHYDLNIKRNKIYNKISKINFLRKKKLYNKNFDFISVSRWLKNIASKSNLLKKKKIHIIGNTIDTSFWKSKNNLIIKKKLNIEKKKFIIGFGGLFNTKDNIIKGTDLLEDLLYSNFFKDNKQDFLFAFFGNGKLRKFQKNGFEIINFGKLNSDKEILEYYNILDIFLNLSRREAFGQTVLEAQSCAIPCLAFKNTGASDIILNNKTGWLLDNYSIKNLEKIIRFAFIKRNKIKLMGKSARTNVIKKFDTKIISQKYLKVYKSILSKNI